MKHLILALVFVAIVLPLAGCEPFAGGVATGAVAMQKISDDAQDRFIVAVNELNTETEKLNTEIGAVKELDLETFIKPETIEAIGSLKGQEKNPATWVALLSLLANGVWAGRTIEKKVKK